MVGAVPGVPDVAVAAHDLIVRAGPGVERELRELTGLRVQAADVVPGLPHEPDLAFLVHGRVTRASTLPWHLPFLDLDRVESALLRQDGGRGEECDSHQHWWTPY